MKAGEITTERTFPKKRIQFVQARIVFPDFPKQFQRYPLAEREPFVH
jgi:hypothetical protein